MRQVCLFLYYFSFHIIIDFFINIRSQIMYSNTQFCITFLCQFKKINAVIIDLGILWFVNKLKQ